MKLQFKVGTVILVLGLLALSFWVGGCKHRKTTDRLNMALYEAQDKVVRSELTIQSQKVQIFKADAQIVSTQGALKQSEEEKAYLRKLHITDVKSITNLKLEIEALKKEGVYKDTLMLRDTITNVIDTIKTAKYKDECIWATVLLKPNKPEFNFGLYTPIKVYVGYEGLLRNKPTVAITSPNPYVNITKANTVIVAENKKFLQKKYPYLIAGFVGGWLIFK